MGTILSVWTVVVFVVFLAIVFWVLSKNKEDFDEQANIPFNEDDNPEQQLNKKEAQHG